MARLWCWIAAGLLALASAESPEDRTKAAAKELLMARAIKGKGQTEAKNARSGFGPTAYFLDDELNLKMSCSVCSVVFRGWSKQFSVQKKAIVNLDPVTGVEEIDREEVSDFYNHVVGQECKRIRAQYGFAWGESGAPSPGKLVKKKFIPEGAAGSKDQQEWVDQFIWHRCDWLADKFALPLNMQIADAQLPGPACPMTDCPKPAEKKAKAEQEEREL
eukprot:TRINITY_DN23341_c0_g1_i1.p1 TRINITY_DN23341_c0_g1~~TRINITY_DN23341_c0_g1_i1.p1  ORF type:complete len:218 (+),score=83.50 TRINITY_DN23341_c0_g1_i1:45-698(+)